MWAVVDIAGGQFRVREGRYVYTPLLQKAPDEVVSFDKVLLLHGKKGVLVGDPAVKGASVEGKVIEHVKGDKVVVLKKKRRKGYQVKRGHRQSFTKVMINKISHAT